MRAEPKTILRFLFEYFEPLRDLLEAQTADGLIRKEILKAVCESRSVSIQNQLMDYKILRSINDDFEFHSVYKNLIEFIISEFRPLLPETIEKYNSSIYKLFQKIRDDADGDKEILKQRITDLGSEIRTFAELVERNTIGLLKETRNIKANIEKVDYKEKIIRASRWIDEYIVPLNKILDANHSESVTNKLNDVGQYVNIKRLGLEDEQLRLQFEQLYQLVISTNDTLLKQSRILTTELLPLIDRIRTESIILTGWIEFLEKPEKYSTPSILKSAKVFAYSEDIFLNTKEFFEQFSKEETIFLDEAELPEEKWIFNKKYYKNRLKESLPVTDFFSWCGQTLADEYGKTETHKFFELINLIFENDLELTFGENTEAIKLKMDKTTIKFPKISIIKNG